jgi:hypothetical protein
VRKFTGRLTSIAAAAAVVVGLLAVAAPAEAAVTVPKPTIKLTHGTYTDSGKTLSFSAALPAKAKSVKVQRLTEGGWATGGKVLKTTKKTQTKRYVTGTIRTVFGKAKFRVVAKVGKKSYTSKTVSATGFKWVLPSSVAEGYDYPHVEAFGSAALDEILSIQAGGVSGVGHATLTDSYHLSASVTCRKATLGVAIGANGTGSATVSAIPAGGTIKHVKVAASATKDVAASKTVTLSGGKPLTISLHVEDFGVADTDREGTSWPNATAGALLWCDSGSA